MVGHSTLTMTLRYMHVAPSALTEAIGLLNFGQPVGGAESAAISSSENVHETVAERAGFVPCDRRRQ
jgi:hypothetical protein